MNSRERLKKRARVMQGREEALWGGMTADGVADIMRRVIDGINAAMPIIREKISEWLDEIGKMDIGSIQRKLDELKGEKYESE